MKLLVNFAPQEANSAALQRTETEALVSILKSYRFSAIRVSPTFPGRLNVARAGWYKNKVSPCRIDLQALGKALQTMKLGLVNYRRS